MRPYGVESRPYNLLMERNWEADLDFLQAQIDSKTKAIIVNNPCNPCGAVYCKEHLKDILKVADQHNLPIIADEIYGNITFGGAKFFPLASLNPKVPILTCDGIGKRWLVPGWRLGWLVIHNRLGAFDKVATGLKESAAMIQGPSVVIQGALPAILKNTPESFFDHTRRCIERNVEVVMRGLAETPGLTLVEPQGAFYMMVGVKLKNFPQFSDVQEFTLTLSGEESLLCFPGSLFGFSAGIRLVLVSPEEVMLEACHRMDDFCRRYYVE